MTPKRGTRKSKAVPAAVATSGHSPFAGLDNRGRATAEDFEREHMGIAEKE